MLPGRYDSRDRDRLEKRASRGEEPSCPSRLPETKAMETRHD
jgi:hypothetical protein